MSQTVKPGSSGKSFEIPKMLIWEAYQKVKANKGAAGVDQQSLADSRSMRSGICTRSGTG
jgi:hypothetical protein